MRLPLTDFSAGLLSGKLAGRYDLPFYLKGCGLLENWQPMVQGGVTYRPGSTYIANTNGNAAARLIAFTCGPSSAFIVEIGVAYIFVYKDGVKIAEITGGTPATVPYLTIAEIQNIHVAMEATKLYLAHQGYPPKVLTWTGGTTFTFGSLTITGNAGQLPFQSSGNYPGAVAGINGRLVFAGSTNEPQAIWASKPFASGDFTYFETISTTYNQIKDSATWADPHVPETEEITTTRDVTTAGNAFKIELRSDENEAIVGLATVKDLIVSTTTSEWVIPRDVTATNPRAQLQSRSGGTKIQPKTLEGMTFIASSTKQIKAAQYVADSDTYEAIDITALSEAASAGISGWDFGQHPVPTLYVVLADGTMAILMKNKVLGTQTWWKYSLGASGGADAIESVATITGSDGDDDVYLIEKRGATRLITKMDRPFAGLHLDAAENVTKAAAVLTGLGHLEGMAVTIVALGVVYTGTVTSGEVTAPAVANGTVCRVGLDYTATMRTMRLPAPIDDAMGMAEPRRVSRVGASMYQSSAVKIGGRTDRLTPYTWASAFSGELKIDFGGEVGEDCWVYVIQDTPLPATVLAIVPEVD